MGLNLNLKHNKSTMCILIRKQSRGRQLQQSHSQLHHTHLHAIPLMCFPRDCKRLHGSGITLMHHKIAHSLCTTTACHASIPFDLLLCSPSRHSNPHDLTYSRNLPAIQDDVRKLIEEHLLKREVPSNAMQALSMAEALRLVFVEAESCLRCLLSRMVLMSLRTWRCGRSSSCVRCCLLVRSLAVY